MKTENGLSCSAGNITPMKVVDTTANTDPPSAGPAPGSEPGASTSTTTEAAATPPATRMSWARSNRR